MQSFDIILNFIFSVFKTGIVCKMLAQKLPGQLVERFKESFAKKIALGRYFFIKLMFFSVF